MSVMAHLQKLGVGAISEGDIRRRVHAESAT